MSFRLRAGLLIASAALIAACASRPFQLPPDRTFGPVSDDDLFAEIVKACPRFPITARLRVEGTVVGRRVRRSLRVGTDGSYMRVEASAADGVPFVLWGGRLPGAQRAGLWLPNERKVVELDDLRRLADAAIGVPLNSTDLIGILTTCPLFEGGSVDVLPLAPNARQLVMTGSGTHQMELTRRNSHSPWRVRAAIVSRPDWPRWGMEFSSGIGEVPRSVRISRLEWTGEPSRDLDLRVRIDRLRVDMGIGPSVLTPSPPASAARVTLAELTSASGGRPLLVQ